MGKEFIETLSAQRGFDTENYGGPFKEWSDASLHVWFWVFSLPKINTWKLRPTTN